MPEWLSFIFLPFLKIRQNDNQTFFLRFLKIARMTIRHFPPVSMGENVLISSWQIFRKGRKVSNSHSGKFSKTEENVQLSHWRIFKNGRRMFDCHSGNFSNMEGKYPTLIMANFQKSEENVQMLLSEGLLDIFFLVLKIC